MMGVSIELGHRRACITYDHDSPVERALEVENDHGEDSALTVAERHFGADSYRS